MTEQADILWRPGAYERERSQMARFRDLLAERGHGPFPDYHALHAFSIREPEAFWAAVWDYAGIRAHQPYERVLGRQEMPGAEWFPGARLNFAENLLRHAAGPLADETAVVSCAEGRPTERFSHRELRDQVAALQAFLREQGIGVGDRVAGLVGNTHEALVGMLAATGLGAVWSSASPDFGPQAVLDRFGQIEPKALLTVNGYAFNGKTFPRQSEVSQIIDALPSLRAAVGIPLLPEEDLPGHAAITPWSQIQSSYAGAEPVFESLPPDHPVYILYSSGTTGRPKCIVHGAAGILLNHAKELMLHGDIGSGDRFFYFTTCGWMMWNWLASGLMTGARVITYDGSPAYPSLDACWALAESEGMTHFGTSAKFLAACRKEGLTPGRSHDLANLRVIFSTGSPLQPEDFDWVYKEVKGNVLLGSISGGTDICGCFVGSTPLLPVRRGEIQCRFLGVDACAFTPEGHDAGHERGELVCRQPLPSMPVGFWGDPDGSRYRKAYFDTFPGVWAHGDFVRFTEHGGAVIYGRSDATLNPGGVRIGTAEIYRQVEDLPEVADSLVVGEPTDDGDVRVLLLLVPAAGQTVDEGLADTIRRRLRERASPRHVPARIVEVPQVPYTRSGKKVELAVARMLQGERHAENRDALANPEALDAIADRLALTDSG